MISASSVAISVFWVVLSTSLLFAQAVKPPERSETHQRPATIQELEWLPQHALAFLSPADTVSAPSISAPDLSRYREFQFGMNLLAVARQADMKASDARVIYQRPVVIQELEWRPERSPASSSQTDPVKEVIFSFYNGELFRMVINYDQYKTEGLTDEDMIEALSAKYGNAARPRAKVIVFSPFQVYGNEEKVLARWEDSQYSFNLFHSSFQPTLGILVFSKAVDALARTAIAASIQLDNQEAPQKEIDNQKKQDA